MRAAALTLLAALGAGCAHKPVLNEVVAKTGRHLEYRGLATHATLCKTCGKDSPVTITFGEPARFTLLIPSCYAHAESKIGDHDHVSVEDLASHATATAGELDIDDCISTHVTAKLWATFPDGLRVDAVIDTALTDPGK